MVTMMPVSTDRAMEQAKAVSTPRMVGIRLAMAGEAPAIRSASQLITVMDIALTATIWAPADRSMLPVMMTKAMPRAMTPVMELLRRMLMMLFQVRKLQLSFSSPWSSMETRSSPRSPG